MDLNQFKVTFDEILQNYVDEKIKQTKTLLDDNQISKYIEYINAFIFSGGKRIRPYCLRLTYKGFGGKNEKAIFNFGIIFELLHTMALIHDDIIDQANKRHNILTVHKYINGLLTKPNEHIAEGQAILLGDLLLSWVYELRYSSHDFNEKLLFDARQNVHKMIEEVILGQMIDVYMTSSDPATSAMIEKKNMFKTAAYTFIRPMLTGAILANTTQNNKDLIIQLGQNLGIAFQIRDDLFDVISGDKTKSAFSDIQEGQQTFLTNYIFTKGSIQDQALLKNCLGKKLNKQQIQDLQGIFVTSGAIDYGKDLIKKYSHQASQILEKIIWINTDTAKGIQSLITKISDLKI